MCLCLPITHECFESGPCVILEMGNTEPKIAFDISDLPD